MSKIKKQKINIGYTRSCDCTDSHFNCLSAKEWLKAQIGVWQFNYEVRDIRDKTMHPATFPLSLARRVISLFTHQGELVVDPFVGSGTTLVAAQDLDRNAVGFDLQPKYVELCQKRLRQQNLFAKTQQIAIQEDARNITDYLQKESVSLIFTSPPYADILNRQKQFHTRQNKQDYPIGIIEQYSQDPKDLGTLNLKDYIKQLGIIFGKMLSLLKPFGRCVLNVADIFADGSNQALHCILINELIKRHYHLKNIIIWDKVNIFNKVNIFGWPSNYITMIGTFEYILDFEKVPIIA